MERAKHVPVPDEEQHFGFFQYVTINIYWFALTARSQVLTPLIVPVLVQRFVGEAVKGEYVGRMRLWALMVALLVQALMGLLSDCCLSRWGRRRPFIFAGTLGEIVIFLLMGVVAGMEGMRGYWAFFALYILSMVASNTAHAATQGLIPDLVPERLHGRFAGVKALLELPLPLVFASFIVGPMVAQGNIWGGLLALSAVLFVSMVLAMFAREQPLTCELPPFDWQPLLRLALMTGAFTLIILGMGAGADYLLARVETPALVIGVGVLGMALAVLLGVWASVALSLGEEVRTHQSFTWWVTNRLTFMVASTNLAGFMLYFLQDRFAGMQGEAAAGPASRIIMFVGIFILLSAVPGGWLADRFGKKPIIALSGLLAGVGTTIVVLAPGLSGIYVGGCFIGAAIGLFYSSNWALGTAIVPQAQAARYLGISNLAGAGSGAIGAYIGGPLADAHGYVILFTIYGFMFFLSILALFGVRQPQKTQTTP